MLLPTSSYAAYRLAQPLAFQNFILDRFPIETQKIARLLFRGELATRYDHSLALLGAVIMMMMFNVTHVRPVTS